MHIANPIYDVVFKYLMEDSKIAKLLISSIIGQEVEILEFRPQEFIAEIDKNKAVKKTKKKKREEGITFFTVYKLDFSAKIKTPEGDKIVLIEIQKAKFATDIMRFRNYLGAQYSNKENIYITQENGKRVKRACEIISIYFLGHKLENIHGVPVIKSKKTYIDVSSGKEIKQKEYFIDSLNHESYIIPIPELKERRRNELEKLLSVFDQSNRTEDEHILNVKEESFPEEYRELIRRLQKAAQEPQIRKVMDIEDEILEELAEKEREKVYELALRDAVIQQQGKILEEKDKKLEEKDDEIELEKIKREESERQIELEKIKREESERQIELEKTKREESERQIELMLQRIKELEDKLNSKK